MCTEPHKTCTSIIHGCIDRATQSPTGEIDPRYGLWCNEPVLLTYVHLVFRSVVTLCTFSFHRADLFSLCYTIVPQKGVHAIMRR